MLPYAYGAACVRCGRVMLPGEALDLDHTDDRGGYLGMAHAACNRAAGARKGNASRARARQARRERFTRMVTEIVLAVEISEDRRHTSLAAAGSADGCTVVELLRYLDGPTAGVEAVLEARASRPVTGVVVDPHSGAGTLLKPLQDAGVAVTEPSSSHVSVAKNMFVDETNAGRLRIVPHPALTAAVRHAQERRLGGSTAWDRRGPGVDQSPLTAVTLAVWLLLTMPPPVVPLVAWR